MVRLGVVNESAGAHVAQIDAGESAASARKVSAPTDATSQSYEVFKVTKIQHFSKLSRNSKNKQNVNFGMGRTGYRFWTRARTALPG